MKHAVILAHPRRRSLSGAIAQAYQGAVAHQGHEVIVRDLYAMGFDPCLRANEIPGPGLPSFGADVLQERARLSDVDVFAFIYPLWFNAPPAILKGYVDRVFSMGFGFDAAVGGSDSRLDGRKLISFTTSGAPDHWVRDTGALSALTQIFDAHLAAVCGLGVIDHLHFGGMVPGITQEAVDEMLAKVRSAISAHFRPHPPVAA